jgi:chaperonin cofactor prefoldin
MINELVNKWTKEMTDTEQYHAQAIDNLEDRIAKLEDKHKTVTKQNELLMEMLSKLIRGKNE